MKKYNAVIKFNEAMTNERVQWVVKRVSNRLNRLLFKKHHNIKGYGTIEKCGQQHKHCHFIINVPTAYADKFELIFNDVVASFSHLRTYPKMNNAFEGWHQPLLTEEGAGHYMNKHFESEPITF